MAIKYFTLDEVRELSMNPYTYKVSEKRISFSAEFKKKFWDMHSKGQLPRNIVKQLGYDPDVLGATRIQGIAEHVREQAESGEGFYEGRRRKLVESEYDKMIPSKALLKMQSEISYLRHELEFLKKIIAADSKKRQNK